MNEVKERINVIIKEPYKNARIASIRNDLETLQRLVEGRIETFPFNGEALIVCNEEGKILGLPFNFHFRDDFAGTVIVCGVDGEEFTDIPIHAVAESGTQIAPVELGKVAGYAG